jgi:hypothetical protein
MAQRSEVVFSDDVDGGAAQGTVRFGVDGQDYEIDLSAGNADRLREAFAAYIVAGRRTSGRRGAGRPARSRPASGGGVSETAAVRAWAAENGHQVSPRGRLPNRVLALYREAVH